MTLAFQVVLPIAMSEPPSSPSLLIWCSPCQLTSCSHPAENDGPLAKKRKRTVIDQVSVLVKETVNQLREMDAAMQAQEDARLQKLMDHEREMQNNLLCQLEAMNERISVENHERHLALVDRILSKFPSSPQWVKLTPEREIAFPSQPAQWDLCHCFFHLQQNKAKHIDGVSASDPHLVGTRDPPLQSYCFFFSKVTCGLAQMQPMNKSCVVVGLDCLVDFPHNAQDNAESSRGHRSRERIIGSDK